MQLTSDGAAIHLQLDGFADLLNEALKEHEGARLQQQQHSKAANGGNLSSV